MTPEETKIVDIITVVICNKIRQAGHVAYSMAPVHDHHHTKEGQLTAISKLSDSHKQPK